MFLTCFSSLVVLLYIVLCAKIIYRNSKCAVTAVTLSCVYLLLTIGVIGAALTFLRQFVGLKSVSLCLLAVDVVFFIAVMRLKLLKKHIHSDLRVWLGWICISLFIVAMAVWHFGPHLKLIYIDIDSSRYFKQAMDIRRTGKISAEYLSPLILTLAIQWVSPFVRAVSLYKGMILAHIGVQLISTWMFYVLAQKLNHGRFARVENVVLTILYVSGYQLYILVYGTFFHWQDGTLILMFLIYHFIEIQHNRKEIVLELFSILLGVFGLIVCYPFYMIIALVLFLPEGIRWLLKHFGNMKKSVKISLPIAGIVLLIAGAFFAYQRVQTLEDLFGNLQEAGVIYKEPFLDFVYFVPFLIAYIVMLLKKKVKDDCNLIFRLNIEGLLFMVVWFVLYANKLISTYYYYRCYYVIWLLMWLMVAHVIPLLKEQKQSLFLGAYAAMYLLAVVTSVVGINKVFTNVNEEMFLSDKTTQTMCPLYAFNIEQLVNKPPAAVSDEIFEGYNYIVTELGDTKVNMLNSYFSYMQSHWFMAVTDISHENRFNNLWYSSVMEVMRDLDCTETKYVFVLKTDATWMQYYDILQKTNVLYENTECMVLGVPQSGMWQHAIADYLSKDTPRYELFDHVNNSYGPSNVRVLCEEEDSQLDKKTYQILAKEVVTEYIGEITPDNLSEYIQQFNDKKIQSVIVFKDTEMYRKNKKYFDSLYLVYENEAGVIVGPEDGVWPADTSE